MQPLPLVAASQEGIGITVFQWPERWRGFHIGFFSAGAAEVGGRPKPPKPEF